MKNNEDEILKRIGRKVFEERKAKGWTQEALADYADIDRSYIGYIENGKQNISVSMLCKIANILDIPLVDLFIWTKRKN